MTSGRRLGNLRDRRLDEESGGEREQGDRVLAEPKLECPICFAEREGRLPLRVGLSIFCDRHRKLVPNDRYLVERDAPWLRRGLRISAPREPERTLEQKALDFPDEAE